MNTTSNEGLAPLSEETIERMEATVFERIAESPREAAGAGHAHSARRKGKAQTQTNRAAEPRRRRRAWLTGLGVAAAFAVGAVVSPALVNNGGIHTMSDTVSAPFTESAQSQPQPLKLHDSLGSADMPTEVQQTEPAIIASGSVDVRVDDVQAATEEIRALATKLGGYIDSMEIDGGQYAPFDAAENDATHPDVKADYGWLSVRVPAAKLNDAMQDMSDVGTVLSSSLNQTDVTATAVDLRARIDALQASVDRLTELMTQSGSVGDLIQVETALSERQAELESHKQQLETLEDQVSMSSLSVQLTRTQSTVQADPAGFSDGLRTGWNGLIATVNGLVIAVGFLLPWLLVVGIAGLIVWPIVRRVRRKRRARTRTQLDETLESSFEEPTDAG